MLAACLRAASATLLHAAAGLRSIQSAGVPSTNMSGSSAPVHLDFASESGSYRQRSHECRQRGSRLGRSSGSECINGGSAVRDCTTMTAICAVHTSPAARSSGKRPTSARAFPRSPDERRGSSPQRSVSRRQNLSEARPIDYAVPLAISLYLLPSILPRSLLTAQIMAPSTPSRNRSNTL